MAIKIGERDKKFLIGGVVFVVCYLFFLFIAQPIYIKQVNINKRIKEKSNFIKKYYEVLNQTAHYQAKEIVNKNNTTTLEQKFLKENEPGLAAAGLQRILQESSKGVVNIKKTQVKKTRFISGVLAIPIEITINSNLKNLALFIMRIENHQKFLIVEEFRSRRINKQEPEDLLTRLLITGFIKKLESKTGKPI